MCSNRSVVRNTKLIALGVVLKERVSLIVDDRMRQMICVLPAIEMPKRFFETGSNLQLAHPEVEVHSDNSHTVPVLFDFATRSYQLFISTIQHNARQNMAIEKNTKDGKSEGTGTDLCCDKCVSREISLVKDNSSR